MLEASGKVRPAQTAADARTIFSCGTPMEGVDLRIVNPDMAEPCDEGNVGEIWLRSPCVTAGYYNKTALNAQVFQVCAVPCVVLLGVPGRGWTSNIQPAMNLENSQV